jgi:hypothetical protein
MSPHLTISPAIPGLLFGIALCSGVSAADTRPVPAGCEADPAPVSVHCGHAPTPAFDVNGRLWVAWVQDGHVRVASSGDQGANFSPAVTVNPTAEDTYHDGENRPKLALGGNGEIYVTYTRRLEERFAGDIRFSRSTDGGRSFSEPVTLNDNREPISHRFDALVVDGENAVIVMWLDARDAAAARHSGVEYRGSALYYTRSTDGGETFSPDRKLADHACQCCRLGLAVDPDGLPVVLWRHIFEPNIRDHAVLAFDAVEQPGTLRRASRDDWAVDACPHHGPALSIPEDGMYHVVWFTNASEQRRGPYYARSPDRGESFSEPLPLGRPEAAASHPNVLAVGERVALAWTEVEGDHSMLYVRQSADGGESWGEPTVLARALGPSDRPLLLADEGRVHVSWHSPAEGYRLIEVALP